MPLHKRSNHDDDAAAFLDAVDSDLQHWSWDSSSKLLTPPSGEGWPDVELYLDDGDLDIYEDGSSVDKEVRFVSNRHDNALFVEEVDYCFYFESEPGEESNGFGMVRYTPDPDDPRSDKHVVVLFANKVSQQAPGHCVVMEDEDGAPWQHASLWSPRQTMDFGQDGRLITPNGGHVLVPMLVSSPGYRGILPLDGMMTLYGRESDYSIDEWAGHTFTTDGGAKSWVMFPIGDTDSGLNNAVLVARFDGVGHDS